MRYTSDVRRPTITASGLPIGYTEPLPPRQRYTTRGGAIASLFTGPLASRSPRIALPASGSYQYPARRYD